MMLPEDEVGPFLMTTQRINKNLKTDFPNNPIKVPFLFQKSISAKHTVKISGLTLS